VKRAEAIGIAGGWGEGGKRDAAGWEGAERLKEGKRRRRRRARQNGAAGGGRRDGGLVSIRRQ